MGKGGLSDLRLKKKDYLWKFLYAEYVIYYSHTFMDKETEALWDENLCDQCAVELELEITCVWSKGLWYSEILKRYFFSTCSKGWLSSNQASTVFLSWTAFIICKMEEIKMHTE